MLYSILLALGSHPAIASPKPELVALVPAEDVQHVIALGPAGEVYEPDGHGAWSRRHAFNLSVPLAHAARGAAGVIAGGGGAVFRLADNGWTAIRLAQHGKAVTSEGRRAVAAIGHDVFELDRGSEPTRLFHAPNEILELAAGSTGVVIRTSAGTFRIEHGKPQPIANMPVVARLVSDRWAMTGGGMLDLRTGVMRAFPPGSQVGPTAATPDGSAVAVADNAGGHELLVIHVGGKLDREPIPLAGGGTPIAVDMDRAGNVAIALTDGRLLLHDRKGWSTVAVIDDIPAHPPGSPPAAQ